MKIEDMTDAELEDEASTLESTLGQIGHAQAALNEASSALEYCNARYEEPIIKAIDSIANVAAQLNETRKGMVALFEKAKYEQKEREAI